MKNQLSKDHFYPYFPFYLRRSFYLHTGLILLSLFGGKILIDRQKALRDKNIELIEASVRVDMVAMPKYTLNELKNISSGSEEAAPSDLQKKETPEIEKPVEKIETKEEIKEEVKEAQHNDPSPAFLEEQKKKRMDFLGKLKAISNKKIVGQGDLKAEKGLQGEKVSALKDLVLAGNKLNTGTAIYGSNNAQEMTAFQVYVSRLPDRVRPHWRLPSFLLDKKELKCRVRIWLGMNGELSRAEIYQSSGDNEYDQRALEAVRSATPYPHLQEDFGKRAMKGDIVLGFPL